MRLKQHRVIYLNFVNWLIKLQRNQYIFTERCKINIPRNENNLFNSTRFAEFATHRVLHGNRTDGMSSTVCFFLFHFQLKIIPPSSPIEKTRLHLRKLILTSSLHPSPFRLSRSRFHFP